MQFCDSRANAFTRVGPVGLSDPLWRSNLSSIRTEMITWTGMVAAHNRIYLRSKDTVAALDSSTGQILWSQPMQVREIAAGGGGALVVLTESGLVTIDGQSGKNRWTADLPLASFSPRLVPGFDFVMVATSYSDDASGINVFDLTDGHKVAWNSGASWKVANQLSVFEYPTLITAGDNALICITARGPSVLEVAGTPGVPITCFKGRYVRGAGEKKTVSAVVSETGKLLDAWQKDETSDAWGTATFLSVPTGAGAVGYFADAGSLISFNPTDGEAKWKVKKGWLMTAMATTVGRTIGAFEMPQGAGTEIQNIDLTNGSVASRVQIPGVKVTQVIIAYRRLYALGFFNPGGAAASVPVVICFGRKG